LDHNQISPQTKISKASKPKKFLVGFHMGFKKEKQERKIKLIIRCKNEVTVSE
jgi:hypothetical protein